MWEPTKYINYDLDNFMNSCPKSIEFSGEKKVGPTPEMLALYLNRKVTNGRVEYYGTHSFNNLLSKIKTDLSCNDPVIALIGTGPIS